MIWRSAQAMKKRVLIVCSESPYPVVVGGYERLIKEYESNIFSDYDVYFLICRKDSLKALLHYGAPVTDQTEKERLLDQRFEFALFIHSDFDFMGPRIISPLIERIPSFCFTQLHPNEEFTDGRFRGILTHFSESPHENVLVIGGFYDPSVVFKNRQGDDFVVCVGRIHERKNQLELVRHYREKIYLKHQLPLYLVGGSSQDDYYDLVAQFVDNVSVLSTSDPRQPLAHTNWKSLEQIAEICNRARMFVMASEEESFCLALVEAMACGTTCVVNGIYYGFDPDDLRPHVYGNITGRQGSTLDLVDEVLERDIRIDASEWVRKYNVAGAKERILTFINERL
jgi:glycosyltransferase involved in cell wall biosynthesis